MAEPDDATLNDEIRAAAAVIRGADAILIGAGAGMGVDSGLPDFRGDAGFWKAYPPFRGQSFADISTPHWFQTDPQLAWGFFGHRLQLYRTTIPHSGFGLLRTWGEHCPLGYFVFTSNVDGQFQRAGFREDRIVECHGSIHFLQCREGCSSEIWSAGDRVVDVDPESIRATSSLPVCPRCGKLARPNILMFDDFGWLSPRTAAQRDRYSRWLNRVAGKKVVAVELGAGTAIPTVRIECERRASTVVRINPRDVERPPRGHLLPLGAAVALRALDGHVRV